MNRHDPVELPSWLVIDEWDCVSQLDSTGKILNDSMFRTNTSADYIERAAKVTY